MAIKSVLHTNQQSIDRVLGAGLPVMLVFWTSKEPVADANEVELDLLAQIYAGKALIARVNVGEEPSLAARFNVQHLPSYLFFKDGERVGTVTVPKDGSRINDWLRYVTGEDSKPPQSQSADGHNGHNGHSQKASATPLHLTDHSFDQTINGDKPVLVDFWAAWCGPCHMIAPSIDQLAKEFSGRAVVAKLNIDDNQATARRFNVMSIPTLLVFKGGDVVERIVGVQPLPTLRQILAKHAGS